MRRPRVKNLALTVTSAQLAALFAASTLAGIPLASASEVAGQIVSVKGRVLIRREEKGAGPAQFARAGSDVRQGDIINTPSNGGVKILLKDKTVVDLGPSALFDISHFKANSGKDREVGLGLAYGSIRASVTQKIEGKGKFNVKTRAVTMGVRGTEFVIKTDISNLAEMKNSPPPPAAKGQSTAEAAKANAAAAPKTEIAVIQGKVEVAQNEAPKPKGDLGTGKSIPPPKAIPIEAGQKIAVAVATPASLDANAPAIAPPKVEQMSIAETKQVAAAARMEDNTFNNAIVIDTGGDSGSNSSADRGPASGDGGDRGGMSAGALTSALISESIADPTVTAMSEAPVAFDLPGVPTFDQIFVAPVQLQAGGLQRVTVRIFR